eukprot:SAG11_NODE_9681_length_890_cov_1.018963_1_plen_122_part_10
MDRSQRQWVPRYPETPLAAARPETPVAAAVPPLPPPSERLKHAKTLSKRLSWGQGKENETTGEEVEVGESNVVTAAAATSQVLVDAGAAEIESERTSADAARSRVRAYDPSATPEVWSALTT